MNPTHLNCPCCHAPVAVDRFEWASGRTADFWVCPECDYVFLRPAAREQPTHGGAEVTREPVRECSTCA